MDTIAGFRRRLRGERGAELIEMALVTPILLLIVAAIFDFGMMFRSWEVVTNAAREGARVGVLPAYTNNENVRQRVQQYMQASGVASACTLQTIAGGTCPATACSVCVQSQTLATGAGSFTARVVTVTSTQSLPSLSVIGTVFGGSFGTINVAATSAMRTETAGAPAP
jgi:Flp pilus assembly protein TadG